MTLWPHPLSPTPTARCCCPTFHSFGTSQSQTSGRALLGWDIWGCYQENGGCHPNQANALPCPAFQRCQPVMGTGTQGFRCRTLRAAGRSVSARQKWTFPSSPRPSLAFSMHPLKQLQGRAVGPLVRECAWAPVCDKGQELGVPLVSEHRTSLPGHQGRKGTGEEDGTEICSRCLRGSRRQGWVILLD